MSRLLRIEDPTDPRVEAYRDIRERDLTGRGGRFVIEGEVVLRAAIARGRFAIESLLLSDNRAAPLNDLVAGLPEEVSVFVAGRAVFDPLAGFPMHRGVLAIGLRGPPPIPAKMVANLPAKALVMVLCGIANHDNMGGLMRNAAAFGVDLVVIDEASCDPLYRKAIRVSAGAALTVPFMRAGTVDALVDLLQEAGFAVLATSPAAGVPLGSVEPSARTAVLFGAEGPGLPLAVLSRLAGIRIDMAPGFDSLNVATTSGIVLHHLRSVLGRTIASPDLRGDSPRR